MREIRKSGSVGGPLVDSRSASGLSRLRFGFGLRAKNKSAALGAGCHHRKVVGRRFRINLTFAVRKRMNAIWWYQ
jgi:hypothetical protein